jgi:hypothetical protein
MKQFLIGLIMLNAAKRFRQATEPSVTGFWLVILSVVVMAAQDVAQPLNYTGPQCMSNCPGDIGPKADTAAVRAAMLEVMHGMGPAGVGHMDVVHVVGNYAIITEYAPGGPFPFKRISDEHWQLISNDELPSIDMLIHAGVPASVAKQLCSHNWPKGRVSGCFEKQ